MKAKYALAVVAVLSLAALVLFYLVDCDTFCFDCNEKASAAKVGVKSMERACEAFHLKHKSFPGKLESLLEPPDGGKPYVESILDPWGILFRYDPIGPRHKGTLPDIWTVDPKDGTIIGNWKNE